MMTQWLEPAKRQYQKYLEVKKQKQLETPEYRQISDELRCESEPDQPLVFGVIGAGKVFDRWMWDFQRIPSKFRLEMRCLFDAVGENARAKATGFGIPVCCEQCEQLLSDKEVQAVYIATPNHLHAQYAIEALRAGKHVLCEKPIARSAAELAQMQAAAEEHNVILLEGMWMRTLPLMRTLQQIVDEGCIGKVGYLSADCCNNDDPAQYPSLFSLKRCGGALMDVGCYALHFAHLFFRGMPTIQASVKRADSGVDLTSTATLTFPDGIAVLTQSLGAAGGANAVLHGTDGWIHVPRYLDSPSEFTVYKPDGRRTVYRYARTRDRRPIGYAYEILCFADCIRSGAHNCVAIPAEATKLVTGELEQIRRSCGIFFDGENE